MKITQAMMLKKKQQIINEIGECQSVKNKFPHYFQYFLGLLKRHPKYSEIINDICDISILKHPLWKSKDVFIKVKGIEEKVLISLNSCIKGKVSSYRENLNMAMRYAVENQIYRYKMNNPSICCMCFCACEFNKHIDHEEPQFVELVENFLSKFKSNELPEDFIRDDKNRKVFNDIDFEKNGLNITTKMPN